MDPRALSLPSYPKVEKFTLINVVNHIDDIEKAMGIEHGKLNNALFNGKNLQILGDQLALIRAAKTKEANVENIMRLGYRDREYAITLKQRVAEKLKAEAEKLCTEHSEAVAAAKDKFAGEPCGMGNSSVWLYYIKEYWAHLMQYLAFQAYLSCMSMSDKREMTGIFNVMFKGIATITEDEKFQLDATFVNAIVTDGMEKIDAIRSRLRTQVQGTEFMQGFSGDTSYQGLFPSQWEMGGGPKHAQEEAQEAKKILTDLAFNAEKKLARLKELRISALVDDCDQELRKEKKNQRKAAQSETKPEPAPEPRPAPESRPDPASEPPAPARTLTYLQSHPRVGSLLQVLTIAASVILFAGLCVGAGFLFTLGGLALVPAIFAAAGFMVAGAGAVMGGYTVYDIIRDKSVLAPENPPVKEKDSTGKVISALAVDDSRRPVRLDASPSLESRRPELIDAASAQGTHLHPGQANGRQPEHINGRHPERSEGSPAPDVVTSEEQPPPSLKQT